MAVKKAETAKSYLIEPVIKQSESEVLPSEPMQPQVELPDHYLVVFNAFEDFRRGHVITNPQKIQDVLNSHYVNFVHKVRRSAFS